MLFISLAFSPLFKKSKVETINTEISMKINSAPIFFNQLDIIKIALNCDAIKCLFTLINECIHSLLNSSPFDNLNFL